MSPEPRRALPRFSYTELLDFEMSAVSLEVPKARAIRDRFGISQARYYHALNQIIDMPEAAQYAPSVVSRLRRLRERRRRRTAGPVVDPPKEPTPVPGQRRLRLFAADRGFPASTRVPDAAGGASLKRRERGERRRNVQAARDVPGGRLRR